MYNYYLGGKDNYAVDQEAARDVLRVAPEVRNIAKANRAFLQRAVRFVVGEVGVRQILDVGTGIPTAGNIHDVAAEVAPDVRVAYVDNDPIVHVHAKALMSGGGTTAIVLADLREPEAILAHPQVRRLIDLDQPFALFLVAILHFIEEEDNPTRIVAAFRDAMPPGSYLVLSHVTGDLSLEVATRAAAVYDRATSTATLRSYAQISTFFDGFDIIDPGIVQLPLWRPEGQRPRAKDLHKIWMYGGVGRRI
jgi:hypothetical protein